MPRMYELRHFDDGEPASFLKAKGKYPAIWLP